MYVLTVNCAVLFFCITVIVLLFQGVDISQFLITFTCHRKKYCLFILLRYSFVLSFINVNTDLQMGGKLKGNLVVLLCCGGHFACMIWVHLFP